MKPVFMAVNSNGGTTHGDEHILKLLKMYPIKVQRDRHLAYQRDPRFRIYQDHSGGRLVTILTCDLDDGTQKGHRIFAECGTRETALNIRKRWVGMAR